ncbi:MAG TPA: hypothetical protein VFV49_10995, partial [Thermoanaerobaculia bacterium]|nr:hypothetical protein [Thermoanaerobaculia bacterium]
VEYSREKRTYDWSLTGTDIGDGFRADLGFIPQVGYRELFARGGLRYYPGKGKVRFFRPGFELAQQTNQDGDKIYELVSLGVNGIGVKNLNFQVLFRPREQIRVGNQLLEQTYGVIFVQFDPSRRFPRIFIDSRFGDSIDFGGARVGTGATVALGATLRPHDRLDLQFTLNREWLDIDDDRLFTADVQRVRAQYSFSAKSLLRVIAQYDEVEFGSGAKNGNFLGSVLYSYKLNWQTVLFAGYGDDRVLNESYDLEEGRRSFFFKVSYAFLR